MPPETLNQLLERAVGFPDTGLRLLDRREREQWVPWPEIHGGAVSVAGGLRSKGIEAGQRVALIYPTGREFFDAFFGILLAGAVPVPLYPPVRLGRLDEYHQRTAAMLRAAGARLVLADRRVRRLLGPTVAAASPVLGCLTLRDLPRDAGSDVVQVEPDALALVQFSSGTTVEPKPVALSHRAILAHVRALNSFWPDSDEEIHSGLSWLPLYHDMGLIGCVFPALERPAVLTLLGPEVFVARPAIWLRAMSRYGASISVAPNFAYGLCVDKVRDDELDGVDLSAWRVALNGAEPVAPTVLRAFQERFARWGFRPEALTPVYGLSEATLAVTFSALGRPPHGERFDREILATEGRAELAAEGIELMSVGRPLPGVEVRIAGAASQELPSGQVGRVLVKGPSIMEGYLGRPEATARALHDGWLDTGDLGFFHGGELFLTGRAKDVVILRGRNYQPAEIEHAVEAVDSVRRGCCVAVSHLPEGAPGEELLIFVEFRRGSSPTSTAVLPKACTEAVLAATGLKPDRVLVLEPGTLPRTSSGKLRRQEALRLHLTGELSAPDRVTPLLLTGALARSALAFARTKPEAAK
ncbi:MAG: fatty acyl-AMP ligase [bacterium]|nr:fatty acyl-AMP ligase [bacterium]